MNDSPATQNLPFDLRLPESLPLELGSSKPGSALI